MSQGPWYSSPIEVSQGDTYSQQFFPLLGTTLEDCQPRDFTGWSVKMQVRSSQDASSPLLLTLDNAGSGGLTLVSGGVVQGAPFTMPPAFPNGIQISITDVQSLAIAAGEYWYDVMAHLGDGGAQFLQMNGPFIVLGTVTR